LASDAVGSADKVGRVECVASATVEIKSDQFSEAAFDRFIGARTVGTSRMTTTSSETLLLFEAPSAAWIENSKPGTVPFAASTT
jgi:hypothetical protein